MLIQMERNHLAKGIKFMRKILQNRSLPQYEQEKPSLLSKWMFALLITGLVILGSCRVCHAQEFSDVQIVNAIFLAEGGYHAQYPYGIRSIKCDGYAQCRKICLTTVVRNRQRFAKYGYKNSPDFITFLGDRYSPVKGRISVSERRLNKFWIKNMKYLLRRGL